MPAILALLLIALTSSAFACDGVETTVLPVTFEAVDAGYTAILSILEATDLQPGDEAATIAAANRFYAPYSEIGANGFKIEDAEKLLAPLRVIATNTNLSLDLRGSAYVALAQIEGIMARKIGEEAALYQFGKLKRAGSLGKDAIRDLEAALALNPKNIEAAKAYGKAAADVIAKGPTVISLIKTFGGLDVVDKALKAIRAMKENGITSTANYQSVATYLTKEGKTY